MSQKEKASYATDFLTGNFSFFYLSTIFIHSMSELLYFTNIRWKRALIFHYNF